LRASRDIASERWAPSSSSCSVWCITGYSNGDAILLPTFDLGACTPAVIAGDAYTTSIWYESTAITQLALYTRTAGGFWSYWTQATFITPAVPVGAVGSASVSR
jgi:hypothetical protein